MTDIIPLIAIAVVGLGLGRFLLLILQALLAAFWPDRFEFAEKTVKVFRFKTRA